MVSEATVMRITWKAKKDNRIPCPISTSWVTPSFVWIHLAESEYKSELLRVIDEVKKEFEIPFTISDDGRPGSVAIY